MDEEIEALLAQRLAEADAKGKAKLSKMQKDWLNERNDECADQESCLSAMLRDRVAALRTPALGTEVIPAEEGQGYRIATRRTVQFPQLRGLKVREVQKAVNEQIAAEAKEWSCPGGKPGYSASAQVMHLDADVFSYRIKFDVNCGEQQDRREESRNFDLNTGAALTVTQLFREGLAPQAIMDVVYKGAKIDPDCKEALASAPLEFNILGEDLTFYPRLPLKVAACSTEVTIPLRKLKPFLRPGVLGVQ
jgi:hypothetical protein